MASFCFATALILADVPSQSDTLDVSSATTSESSGAFFQSALQCYDKDQSEEAVAHLMKIAEQERSPEAIAMLTRFELGTTGNDGGERRGHYTLPGGTLVGN